MIQRSQIHAPRRMPSPIRVQHDAMPRAAGAIKYDPLWRTSIAHQNGAIARKSLRNFIGRRHYANDAPTWKR